jgi:hypothetical protein
MEEKKKKKKDRITSRRMWRGKGEKIFFIEWGESLYDKTFCKKGEYERRKKGTGIKKEKGSGVEECREDKEGNVFLYRVRRRPPW